jgi:hypothetical protein
MDVIPSAPPVEKIYPSLDVSDSHSLHSLPSVAKGTNGGENDNFRLHKINLILSELGQQTKHYEAVKKKYAKTRSVFYTLGVSCGTLSAILSGSGLPVTLTGPGAIVGIPLGTLGGILGLVSAVCATATKKLSKKISKHERTVQLAKAKANTVAGLVSKALRDGHVDDREFEIILAEDNKYMEMKGEIRQRNQIEVVKDLSEESRKKIYEEAKKELRQKLGN